MNAAARPALPRCCEGRRIEVVGTVQGVGFRPWVYRLAREEGLRGSVANESSGVRIDAFGPEASLDAFLERLRLEPPPAAAVREVRWREIPVEPVGEFVIAASGEGAARRVSIPPDLATCDECLRELFDPADRRYRYPFINCTRCGPRYTIAQDVPYDRAATTMAGFAMCPLCRAEYETPENRRFHAQPNACPVCGPRLWLADAAGGRLDEPDPVLAAARALQAGLIVAVKGIGGFHLACDATCEAAVERLRRRKRREAKPFAVMVRDLAAAERIAVLSPAERALLTSVERPIVLVPRRPESAEGAKALAPDTGQLAPAVAPESPLAGLMLPYTPLHHLLLADAGRPLVMTSGNLAEEPIACEDGEALHRLGAPAGAGRTALPAIDRSTARKPSRRGDGVADLFLFHDRPIANRCEDSVARVVAGRPVVLRRARGWVPRPIALPRPVQCPVLACGGQLKNTFCLAAGDAAWLGPHGGDLDNLAAFAAYEEAIGRLERFLGIAPEVVAYDLHPEYLSTRYALGRPEAVKVGVQHHHAHVASAMAEHGLLGPVLGVAFDGTGWGLDGTAWGGEFLLAEAGRYERAATFRPLPLPGGDRAIREVWRIALALLDDAFEGDPPLDALPLFAGIDRRSIAVVRRMIAERVNAPLARGVGRLFDGLGALGLGRPRARFEGEVALAWNLAADPGERERYPFTIDWSAAPAEIDTRPLVRAAVADLLAGRGAPIVSARFHDTLAAAADAVVRKMATVAGRLPVVLTGGCFQNALLAERLRVRLAGEFEVLLHGEVPPGDGGIALGQVLIADALTCQGANAFAPSRDERDGRLEGVGPCV